jgi:hypothetical protein
MSAEEDNTYSKELPFSSGDYPEPSNRETEKSRKPTPIKSRDFAFEGPVSPQGKDHAKRKREGNSSNHQNDEMTRRLQSIDPKKLHEIWKQKHNPEWHRRPPPRPPRPMMQMPPQYYPDEYYY